ncbi:MAG: hypothetical protein PHQ35_02570 [Phycisphaerae bacterium]|nr:hypothetical protein [Phycisphaerae bacterium]MDD5380530.1 hypothetical protein [Phycisphaerae bacterium]
MAEPTLVNSTNFQVIEKAAEVYSSLRRAAPVTRRDIKNYIKVYLGVDIPDKRVCKGHNSPMEYLWHSYFYDFATERPTNGDAIVWANRGGGKTELAAIATLLDCVFKPGCQVRILSGSGEQAGRMYEYLTGFLRRGYEEFLAGPIRKSKCRFINGSAVEVLTQSQRSVRGQHIQKLRCDEVELFDEEVFAAAKLTTQSTAGLLAAMEMISTMHRPYGLMQKIVSTAGQLATPVFKWCLWEVIERCTERNCSQCPLWVDCEGKARESEGYLKVDDCITAMRRASRAGWEAEMLCKRPSRENVVFDEFEPAEHIRGVDYDPNLPLYRALDFGFVNPFVCLWVQVDTDGVVRVIDEYVRSRATIDVHAEEIKRRTPAGERSVAATFCDPSGGNRNDVTGTSIVRELRMLGVITRFRRSGILEGIELIRRSLKAGDGKKRLLISPRCQRLIEAMECYRYPEGGRAGELPLKDGLYDHPIDALRYFFVNYRRTGKTASRRY